MYAAYRQNAIQGIEVEIMSISRARRRQNVHGKVADLPTISRSTVAWANKPTRERCSSPAVPWSRSRSKRLSAQLSCSAEAAVAVYTVTFTHYR